MISLPEPTSLFNPLTTATPLGPVEIFAGPFGLLAFAPLLPLVWLLARRWPRAAIILPALIWLAATLQPAAAGVLLAWIAAAVAWVLLLRATRTRGWLSATQMQAGVWIGLHLLALPLWWYPQHSAWYPGRMQVLHAVGFAYLLLRLIAWGVSVAHQPTRPVRLATVAAWLLYAPCMRLGPMILYEQFEERFDIWRQRPRPAWREAGRRLGLFLLGGVGLALVAAQIPRTATEGLDFLTRPDLFHTDELVRVIYLVPIQVYLLLWTYNELAAALGAAVGLRVDDNFRWLPAATSVRDFWRRWHITLGSWLRTYMYIPLGGNRRHVALNYLIVFVYCGVWHGPAWSFVAWGFSQAAALVAQRWWDQLRERRGWQAGRWRPAWTALSWLLTMHYQMLTIFVFVDFEHCGWRLLRELGRRLL